MNYGASRQASSSGPRLSSRDMARMLPAGFATLASKGKWTSPPHLTYLSLKLAEVQQRRIRRVILVIEIAVAVLTLQAIVINRLAGSDYPLALRDGPR
jgi:hypothetical protein